MKKVTVKGITKVIRKKLFLAIDVETFGSFSEPICYDIGFSVIDKEGRIYAKYSYVVHDTFVEMPEQAQTAYYANKFPGYWRDIKEGTRKVASFSVIRQLIHLVCEKWGIKNVIAYNANFDKTALDYTTRFLGLGESFFMFNVEWWDILQMVADTIAQQKTYKNFCQQNNYMTKHKNPRTQMKAEVVYKYITHNNDFIESHTGLEDVLIEAAIFAKCWRQHKKMRHDFYIRKSV